MARGARRQHGAWRLHLPLSTPWPLGAGKGRKSKDQTRRGRPGRPARKGLSACQGIPRYARLTIVHSDPPKVTGRYMHVHVHVQTLRLCNRFPLPEGVGSGYTRRAHNILTSVVDHRGSLPLARCCLPSADFQAPRNTPNPNAPRALTRITYCIVIISRIACRPVCLFIYTNGSFVLEDRRIRGRRQRGAVQWTAWRLTRIRRSSSTKLPLVYINNQTGLHAISDIITIL